MHISITKEKSIGLWSVLIIGIVSVVEIILALSTISVRVGQLSIQVSKIKNVMKSSKFALLLKTFTSYLVA